MKLLFLFIIVSLVSFTAFSQTNDSIIVVQSPSGRLSGLIDIQDLVNEGVNNWENEFKGHWAGVELGINGFARPDYSLYGPDQQNFLANDLIRSNILSLNILQYSKGLQSSRNTIGLVTGLSLSLQSYRLDNNTTLSIDENQKVHPKYLYFDSNQKSKLSVFYLEIPLMAEFQVPVRNIANRIYFSVGINAGKRLSAHTKVKYRIGTKKEKLKSPGDYSIRDFKFAATVRVGYHFINLFATYDLTPFFDDRRGPKLYPFSVGIRLISF
jgi:hypothetical protein